MCEYEQHQSTSDIAFKENLTIRLENAVQALQNLSPFVSDANREAVLEMTRNFQLMFWNCYRRCEFPSRTRCSQVAVLWLSSQGVLSNDFVINCLHFQESRDLETSGNRVYQMLQTFLRNLSLDGLKDFLKFVTRTWKFPCLTCHIVFQYLAIVVTAYCINMFTWIEAAKPFSELYCLWFSYANSYWRFLIHNSLILDL